MTIEFLENSIKSLLRVQMMINYMRRYMKGESEGEMAKIGRADEMRQAWF